MTGTGTNINLNNLDLSNIMTMDGLGAAFDITFDHAVSGDTHG